MPPEVTPRKRSLSNLLLKKPEDMNKGVTVRLLVAVTDGFMERFAVLEARVKELEAARNGTSDDSH